MPTRRRFLRASTRLAAGLTLTPGLLAACADPEADRHTAPNPATDTPPPPDRRLGVALLGLGGYAGGQIAPALQLTTRCRLAGLITGSPEKLPEWQRRYGVADEHCYTYDRLADVADDDAIDVVYVITPTATHKDFTLRALAAGKHVWCEKPMAMDVTECREMIAAAEAADRQLTIGYRMVHEPNTRAFIDHVAARPHGELTGVRALAGYGGTPPPADYWRGQRDMGGGALYDMGVYAINGIRYATGLVPERVLSARQDRLDRPNGTDLTSAFTLRLPGGATAEGWTSVVEKRNLLRAEFADGWAEMQPMQPYRGVRGEASDGTVFGPPVPNQQSLQMDADARAILEATPPVAPGREGLIDVAVIRAVIEAAETGREVPVAIG